MVNYAGKERRKYRRIHRIVGTNIVRHNTREYLPKLDHEVGLNVSEGGVLLECEKRLAKNDRLKVKVMLAFDSVCKIVQPCAKIVWAKRSFRNTYFLGCRFTKISRKDRSTLRKYTASF